MTHAPHRHRAVAHRGSPRRRLPSGRAVTAAAIGGVLLTGAAVGGQLVVNASSEEAVASSRESIGEPPVAADPSQDPAAAGDDTSRSSERPGLTGIDETAAEAADQVEEAAAAAAEKTKKAEAAAAKQAALEEAQRDPRGVAQDMLADYGWDAAQFTCLDALWVGESDWDYTATNPSSGAYGIPQSLPATKMATAGDDWQTNPVTQIRWGLDYIRASYGTPCSANGFKIGNGWY